MKGTLVAKNRIERFVAESHRVFEPNPTGPTLEGEIEGVPGPANARGPDFAFAPVHRRSVTDANGAGAFRVLIRKPTSVPGAPGTVIGVVRHHLEDDAATTPGVPAGLLEGRWEPK